MGGDVAENQALKLSAVDDDIRLLVSFLLLFQQQQEKTTAEGTTYRSTSVDTDVAVSVALLYLL